MTLYPKHPAAVRIVVARADQAMAAHRYDEAIQSLRPIAAQLNAAQQRQLQLAEIFDAAKSDPSKLIEAADAALQAKDFANSVSILESFVSKAGSSPRATEARVKLGWSHYCLNSDKDYDRAEVLWEEVIRKGPPTDLWVGESQWHMVQLLAGPRGKWKEAVTPCEAAAKGAQVGTLRHEQALYTRAWLFWTQKKWASSLAAFKDFVKAYPPKATYPPIIAYMQECEKYIAAGKDEGL